VSSGNTAHRERILIVDDEDSSRELCRLALEHPNRDLVLCPNGEQALEEICKNSFDLVLTDVVMPGINGVDLLEKIKSRNGDIPVLLMSGKGSIPTVVKAMRLGAEDFIEKPFPDPEVIAHAVKRVLKSRKLEQENRSLKMELQRLKQPHFVGGEAMTGVLRTIERIAPLDLTVLITGETGTGKEVAARRIHALSPRAGKPFVVINCGGIPEGLLESLLFGHERGAFTGAVKRAVGYFEKANQGTILLDEIGDMPLSLQVKLLRVLQEKNFQRIGGEDLIEVDCRVIASTHRNLKQMVESGKFREDLFYRLNVLNLHLPPLRERREDIPDFIQHFMRNISAKTGIEARSISEEAVELLKNYDWPGNIRELENTVERILALSNKEILSPDDLPEEIRRNTGKIPREKKDIITFNQAREAFEKKYLIEALEQNDGNVSAAAQISGIPRQNFYLKLKKYNLAPSALRPKKTD
jgi:DNA-binding NtrC family response regulator